MPFLIVSTISSSAIDRNSHSPIDFIDEARTKSFYESGKWSAADREAMYRRAYALMKKHCLNAKNIRAAETNAEAQMTNIMKGLGFRAVTVRFDKKNTQTQ